MPQRAKRKRPPTGPGERIAKANAVSWDLQLTTAPYSERKKGLTTEAQRAQRKNTEKTRGSPRNTRNTRKKEKEEEEKRERRREKKAWPLGFFVLSLLFFLSFFRVFRIFRGDSFCLLFLLFSVLVLCFSLCPL
jgi:hypothetical protein